MIPHGVEVFVGLDPIDLRWGFDRLSGLVLEKLGRQVRCGALFVFFGRHKAAVKVVFFDGSGLCIFYKRLDAGTFRIPLAAIDGDTARQIDEGALEDLLGGIDLEPVRKRRRPTAH